MLAALVVLLLLHGIAHLPGFLSGWQLVTLAELPHLTALLGGRRAGAGLPRRRRPGAASQRLLDGGTIPFMRM